MRIVDPLGWSSHLDPRDLATFSDFTNSLEWYVSDSVCTAYIEFTYLFWKRGFFLDSCSSGMLRSET